MKSAVDGAVAEKLQSLVGTARGGSGRGVGERGGEQAALGEVVAEPALDRGKRGVARCLHAATAP